MDVYSKISPIFKYANGILEFIFDERYPRPLICVSGKRAKDIHAILSKRFLSRENGNGVEVIIPITSFPAVCVWLLASYGVKPSEELLDRLLTSTPKTLADLFWDIVEISSNGKDQNQSQDQRPLIDHKTALKASKIVRELLKLYGLS